MTDKINKAAIERTTARVAACGTSVIASPTLIPSDAQMMAVNRPGRNVFANRLITSGRWTARNMFVMNKFGAPAPTPAKMP